MVDTPTGGQVPLRDVADVTVAPMRNEIAREGGSRKIDVTFNVTDRSLSEVAGEVEQLVAGMPFTPGYHPEVLGEWAEQRSARTRILALSILSLLSMFLILQADSQSFRLAGLVLLCPSLRPGRKRPVRAGNRSCPFLGLGGRVVGIAARNGIILVSHFRHLEIEEGVPFGRELVLRGAEERLAPILMTAMAEGLALLPIVLGGSKSGYEIEHPMAVVIVGGLVTSTLLNLFLVPSLYLRFGLSQAATASSDGWERPV